MYTYAFLQTPTSALDLPPGIAGSLELVNGMGLSALVEPDLVDEALQGSDRQLMQAVLAHDRIIRELFEQTAVLPLRFGTCFVSKDGLLEHLSSHQVDYLTQLKRLQNKAEYLLKLTPVTLAERSIPADVKGREYFLAKKERYQDQASQQQQQHVELLQIVAAIAHTYSDWVHSESQDGIERIYLLGDRQNISVLQQHVEHWQAQFSYWQISLGEALPPYHFV